MRRNNLFNFSQLVRGVVLKRMSALEVEQLDGK